jgi:hypothetical protein
MVFPTGGLGKVADEWEAIGRQMSELNFSFRPLLHGPDETHLVLVSFLVVLLEVGRCPGIV